MRGTHMTTLQKVMLEVLLKQPNMVAKVRYFDQIVARSYAPERIIVEETRHREGHAKLERFEPNLSGILSKARGSLERKGLVQQLYGNDRAIEAWRNGVLEIVNVKPSYRFEHSKADVIVHHKSPFFTGSKQASEGTAIP
jgi:hypothetical protein